MSALNRWFCSEHHCREIHDPETLWKYYMGTGQLERSHRRFRGPVGRRMGWRLGLSSSPLRPRLRHRLYR